MNVVTSRFDRATVNAEDEPRPTGRNVVFLGRSNVGKSSLINRLLGVKDLARTSSRPGRTQTVNFYRINEAFYFVDLPGYGYAKVPEAVRRRWGPMVEGFLERWREAIALALLVVDARHGLTELDRTMREWLEWKEIDFVVSATKADKLSGNGRAAARRRLAGELESDDADAAILTSAKTGLGVKRIWQRLDRALLV